MAQNPPPLSIIISAEDRTRQALASAQQGLAGLQASAISVQSAIVGLTGALAGLGVVVAFRQFVEAAAALDDMAQVTGASVEKLSALANVAKVTGVDLGVVEGALTRLAKGLASTDEESRGAGTALTALGLKAEELQRLDTADALKLVAERLDQYRDGAGKTALAIDLLGKSGAQALPFLKDLAQNGELQARITTEQAQAAADLEDNLRRVAFTTSAAWREFAAATLPTINEFVKSLLEAVNQSGGLRDEVRRLARDGSIRDWAESGAVGVAVLVDAFRNVVNVVNLAGNAVAKSLVDVQVIAKSAQSFLEGPGRNGRTEREIAELRKVQVEAVAGLSESFNKFINAPQFSQAVRERFERLRNEAATAAAEKPTLDYRPNRQREAATAARDELKAIEGFVEQVRQRLIGATQGEFEALRQRAFDVFGKIDIARLSSADFDRLAESFAEVTEGINDLEERARSAAWGRALADAAKLAGESMERAGEEVRRFNEALSLQGQELEFEATLVGKVAFERDKLVRLRRIDLDLQRSIAAVPSDAANYEETVATLTRLAEEARAKVGSALDDIRLKSRDASTGLVQASAEYLDRITNDAETMRTIFDRTFRSMEDSLVRFVTTGKLDFKSLADSIISDLVRIQIRQNITRPLAEAVGGSGGLFGNLAGNLFGRSLISSAPVFPDLPSFDVGTPYVPRDMVALIHQGERIVPAAENARGAYGGVTVVQNISIDSRSDQATILQAMARAKEQAKAEILDSMQRGGAFAR